jgi:flagellar L-ring protein precursor FlgH
MPVLDMSAGKDFQGEGEYKRSDEFTARLTAEVIEILPNGNLVLEARTRIVNDEEDSTITLTGICRSADVTPLNTVLSNQLHDLKIAKTNRGQVKDGTQKGILTKVFEALFAF